MKNQTTEVVANRSRRHMLKIAAGAFGVLAVGGGGLAFWATRRPHVELVSESCSADPRGKFMILVTYASKCGSTGEVAGAIERTLCKTGASVDARPVQSVSNLDGYHAVVLGSAVRYGTWLPEAKQFVKQHQQRLSTLPTALFTLHMNARDDSAQSRHARRSYTEPVCKLITPRDEAFFAGKIDPKTLSWLDRFMVKAVKSPIGDLRDWRAIEQWAATLSALLPPAK